METGPQGRHFRCRVFIMVLAHTALSGCTVPDWLKLNQNAKVNAANPARPTPPDWWKDGMKASTDSAESVHVVHLVFEVLRVDLPVDRISHSRKIWNHVDEIRIEAETAARLARNGLRIGVGNTESWPALSTILKAADARTRDEKLFAQPGLPVTIVVGGIGDPESIFCYTRENRLVGKTFSAGEKLVTLDFAFRPEMGGCTDLTIDLEIRHDSGEVNWEQRDGIIRQVPELERHVFSDVSALFTLRPSEFLIIGPGEKADHHHLVGGCFFGPQGSGQRYETLFCITPKPYQTQEPRRRAS